MGWRRKREAADGVARFGKKKIRKKWLKQANMSCFRNLYFFKKGRPH